MQIELHPEKNIASLSIKKANKKSHFELSELSEMFISFLKEYQSEVENHKKWFVTKKVGKKILKEQYRNITSLC